jgi:Tfp pilus assembly protein PilX
MDDMTKLLAVIALLVVFTFLALGGFQAVRDWVTIGRWQRAIDRDAEIR